MRRVIVRDPQHAKELGIWFHQEPRAWPVEVFDDGTFYDAIGDGVHGEWSGDVEDEEWEEW